MVTSQQPGPAARLSPSQSAIAAANIRVLRQRNGWTQAHLGELMGWPDASTVCAAEGHRSGRQRRFARWEIEQLAAIFASPSGSSLPGAPPAAASRHPVTPAWPAKPSTRPDPTARNRSLTRQ